MRESEPGHVETPVREGLIHSGRRAPSASAAFKPHPAQACSLGCSKREGRRGTEKLNCPLSLTKVRSVLKKEPHINLGELSSLLPCAGKHLLTPHSRRLSLIGIFPLALLTTRPTVYFSILLLFSLLQNVTSTKSRVLSASVHCCICNTQNSTLYPADGH